MDLSKETILITGAAGFVGACLTRRLVSQGVKPHVFVHHHCDMWRLADIRGEIYIHEIDITQFDLLRQCVLKIKPSIIYHLAAHGAYSSQTDAKRIMAVNVTGTLNLLQALEDIDYKLLVNTGSSSEYGFRDKPMKESDALLPNSYYAVSKASQYMLCQYAACYEHKKIVSLRLFSVYGPFEDPGRLVPTLIRSCREGRPLNMADPNTARDFIYVDDVLDAYLNVNQLMKHTADVFNICSGRQCTLKEITDEVIALTKASVKVNWNAMPSRIWDQAVWVGDGKKAMDLLAYHPATSLKEGLMKTITWMAKHG